MKEKKNTKKRNLVYIGYSLKNDCHLEDVKERSEEKQKLGDYRFPHLVKRNSIKELKREQGFLLLAGVEDFPHDSLDEYRPNVYELDRIYRKKLQRFTYVILLSSEDFHFGRIPYSHIFVVSFRDFMEKCNDGIVDKMYQEYKEKTPSKKHLKKQENIKMLYQFLKKKRNPFIATKEIMKELNVTARWVQRYMNEINEMYHNIGYNRFKRKWYVIKNNNKNEK